MKASELVKEVQKLIKEHGDIYVLSEGFLVKDVKMEEEAGNKYVVVSTE